MERVKVFLRVKGGRRDGIFSFSDKSVVDSSGVYDFDGIFYGPEQEGIFKSISPMIDTSADGYNSTIFTYGQTGSGKTYTMEGTEDRPGIIPQTIDRIFSKNITSLSITAVEVYNEKVFDLLSEKPVTIREGKNGIVLEGVNSSICDTPEGAMKVFKLASRNRRTDSNGVNNRSSRSHMVFIMNFVREIGNYAIDSRITLVDLAGSEKTEIAEEKTEGANYQHKKQKISNRTLETSNINRSLLCLSRIIGTLSSEEKARHVSYRDSKLTLILRDSLSQDSNLAIIGTVEPEDQTETKSTVNFLSTAKKIKLTPKSTADERTTEKLIAQIRYLSTENIQLKLHIQKIEDQQKNTKITEVEESIAETIKYTETMKSKVEDISHAVNRLESMIDRIKEKNNRIGNILFDRLIEEKKEEINRINPVCKNTLQNPQQE